MTLTHEDDDNEHQKHPYWYGRIMGILHAMVQYNGPWSCSVDPQCMEFLWVQWYGWDLEHVGGWKAKHLHCVGFVYGEDPAVFGFLDPQEVICGIHLIPAFAHGRTADLLPSSSMACTQCENHEDWQHFYVSMSVNFLVLFYILLIASRFVDWNMLMHFCGGGVSHKSTRSATDQFLTDCDMLNKEYAAGQQEKNENFPRKRSWLPSR